MRVNSVFVLCDIFRELVFEFGLYCLLFSFIFWGVLGVIKIVLDVLWRLLYHIFIVYLSYIYGIFIIYL